MTLPALKNNSFKPSNHNMEECLSELERYGMPAISKHKSGWRCEVSVFVNGEGVSFDVVARQANTPKDAVSVCFDRLMIAIDKIKET